MARLVKNAARGPKTVLDTPDVAPGLAAPNRFFFIIGRQSLGNEHTIYLTRDEAESVIRVWSYELQSQGDARKITTAAPEANYAALLRIRAEAKAHDDRLDDAANDGENAQAPTGDDYNELWSIIIANTPEL